MEMPPSIRSTKKQSLWTIPGQVQAKDPPTKDSRRRSLERRQWLVEFKVLTIHSEMQLLTMKAEKNLQERAWHTLHQRKEESMTTLRFQANRAEIQLGMDLAVRITKPTKITLKAI